MPKRAERLSAAQVAKAPPGRYCDGDGLYLLVRGPTLKFWLLRWVRDGRMKEMGLGPAAGKNPISLADARKKAGKLWRQIRDEGIDPLDQKRTAKADARAAAQRAVSDGKTFKACADAYIRAYEAGWRNAKHGAQWRATLETYAFPFIGDLPVKDIDTQHMNAVLDPIWTVKPETAGRVRGRIEAILDYAKARKFRDGENPARWRGHLENLLPRKSTVARVRHHPALPYREVGTFMATLREQKNSVAARALEFAILTAARTGEVIGARWNEFDLRDGIWTVPGARMKAGKDHRVALSDAAVAILAEMKSARTTDDPNAFVFPGGKQGKPLSNMAMLALLERMGRDDLTTHGFRSTFRDWCAEATNYPHEVAEMALAHTVGDKVEAAYRRGDLFEKRRQLAQEWARYCTQPEAPRGEVVAIRRGAAHAS